MPQIIPKNVSEKSREGCGDKGVALISQTLTFDVSTQYLKHHDISATMELC